MGLDLTLLPFDRDSQYLSFAHSILQCSRDYDLWEYINTLPQMEAPEDFHTYLSREGDENKEPHYGPTPTTPYGNRLRYTQVKYLLNLPGYLTAEMSQKNKAVWAYLNELDRDQKVALYWH